MNYFTLKTADKITPTTGEDVGDLLVNSALAQLERLEKLEHDTSYAVLTAVQLLYIAADAYKAGAAVSLGHSRAARYHQAARQAKQQADDLYAKASAKIAENRKKQVA